MEQEGSSARPIAAPGGVVYRVAYGPNSGPFPAVLSVVVVRLGHTSMFQVCRKVPSRHDSACHNALGLPLAAWVWSIGSLGVARVVSQTALAPLRVVED